MGKRTRQVGTGWMGEGKEGRCGRGEVVDGDGEKRRPVTNCVSSGNTKALKETGRDKVGFSFLV